MTIITAAEMAEHYKPLGDLYLAYKRIEKLEADNARLREAMKGPLAWLERRAVHVGNCKGDSACTCGLTFVKHELRAALQETSQC